MSDKTEQYVRMWLDKAHSDLKNVEIILASQESQLPLDTACFHCQQAAEKFIKAFLVFNGRSFPFTHNLADLVAICMQVDMSFAAIQRKAEILTPFAVEIRYPDDFYMPSRKETEEAFAIAVEVKIFILAKLGRTFADDANSTEEEN